MKYSDEQLKGVEGKDKERVKDIREGYRLKVRLHNGIWGK